MAAVTGGAVLVAMVPGSVPRADGKGQGFGSADASVTLLVGRALQEGGRAARCGAAVPGDGPCTGWREERVRATAHGAGAVLRDTSGHDGTGGARTVALPTDAHGPLQIGLAGAGRLIDVTVQDGHGRHVGGALDPGGRRWANTESLRAGERYTVHVGAQDAAGTPVGVTMAFGTAPPAAGEQITAELGPG
ncbi:hypothetical protein HYE82_32655, partial [Streptomyces sp. BR123]|uniref:Ig-like domain-containing protein n=1 Tax=Streptomyces sp. BR123 TaxID=2749828 RepID=UPI0017BDB806